MNFLSLNINGIGGEHKVAWIRRLKRKHKVSFMAIQETQQSDAEQIDARACWGDTEFGVNHTNSIGRSGGLLNLWDSKSFTSTEVISSHNYLINIGTWVGISTPVIFANIYGPQPIREKAKLWENLKEIKQERKGVLIIMGDFNVVRRPDERFNSIFCPRTAKDFNNFILDSGLIDLKMGGFRYTCCRSEGIKLSKLDRFLISPDFLGIAPKTFVTALPRELSDHSPILLSTNSPDFGPPPFKLFNSWLLRDGFKKAFITRWNNFTGYGTPDQYLAAKLRHVKDALRKWRATEHPKEEAALIKFRKEVEWLDHEAESGTLNPEEVHKKTGLFLRKSQNWKNSKRVT